MRLSSLILFSCFRRELSELKDGHSYIRVAFRKLTFRKKTSEYSAHKICTKFRNFIKLI